VRYKNFKIAGLVLMALMLLCSLSNSETLVIKKENTLSITGYLSLIDYQSSQKLYALTQSDSMEKPKVNMDVYSFKQKSTKRGFLYSLLIPGAGEFYAGSKIKAALFLGLEAAFWTGYFSYHKKGKDKENEYLDYADAHWDVYAYSESLVYRYPDLDLDPITGIVIDTPGVYYGEGTDSIVISHSLYLELGPDLKKDQQYYETIGKYDQFRFGWDDYDGVNFLTLHREFYLDLRHDSNSLLDKANRFVMVSLANHLLSAFDAAISVRSYNRKGEKFSTIDFKIRLAKYNENEIIPKLTVSTKF
jgi:hypothetical protein